MLARQVIPLALSYRTALLSRPASFFSSKWFSEPFWPFPFSRFSVVAPWCMDMKSSSANSEYAWNFTIFRVLLGKRGCLTQRLKPETHVPLSYIYLWWRWLQRCWRIFCQCYQSCNWSALSNASLRWKCGDSRLSIQAPFGKETKCYLNWTCLYYWGNTSSKMLL